VRAVAIFAPELRVVVQVTACAKAAGRRPRLNKSKEPPTMAMITKGTRKSLQCIFISSYTYSIPKTGFLVVWKTFTS
jgi:hypothetical protein